MSMRAQDWELDGWVWFPDSRGDDDDQCLIAVVRGPNYGEPEDHHMLTIDAVMTVPSHELAQYLCELHNDAIGVDWPQGRLHATPDKTDQP